MKSDLQFKKGINLFINQTYLERQMYTLTSCLISHSKSEIKRSILKKFHFYYNLLMRQRLVYKAFFGIDWFTNPTMLLLSKLKNNTIEYLCLLFPTILTFILIMNQNVGK